MHFPEGILKIEEDYINDSLELFLVVQQVGYELNDTISARPEALLHAGVEEIVIHKVPLNFIPDEGIEDFPQDWLEGNGPEILRV